MRMFNQVRFGERLRQLRKARGMTQEKTAEKLGIRRVRYVYMETGRALPTIPILVRIAALYGISTDALLGVERASEEKKPRGSA